MYDREEREAIADGRNNAGCTAETLMISSTYKSFRSTECFSFCVDYQFVDKLVSMLSHPAADKSNKLPLVATLSER